MIIDKEKCIGCGDCLMVCPVDAITLDEKEKKASIDQDACIECFSCQEMCEQNAILEE